MGEISLANLANCIRDAGSSRRSRSTAKAMLKPASWPAESLIYSLYFRPGETAASILDEHRKWNEQYVKPLAKRPVFGKPPRSGSPGCGIGYVSPDFRNHYSRNFTIPLFANHESLPTFEIYCYSTATLKDAITRERSAKGSLRKFGRKFHRR